MFSGDKPREIRKGDRLTAEYLNALRTSVQKSIIGGKGINVTRSGSRMVIERKRDQIIPRVLSGGQLFKVNKSSMTTVWGYTRRIPGSAHTFYDLRSITANADSVQVLVDNASEGLWIHTVTQNKRYSWETRLVADSPPVYYAQEGSRQHVEVGGKVYALGSAIRIPPPHEFGLDEISSTGTLETIYDITANSMYQAVAASATHVFWFMQSVGFPTYSARLYKSAVPGLTGTSSLALSGKPFYAAASHSAGAIYAIGREEYPSPPTTNKIITKFSTTPTEITSITTALPMSIPVAASAGHISASAAYVIESGAGETALREVTTLGVVWTFEPYGAGVPVDRVPVWIDVDNVYIAGKNDDKYGVWKLGLLGAVEDWWECPAFTSPIKAITGYGGYIYAGVSQV